MFSVDFTRTPVILTKFVTKRHDCTMCVTFWTYVLLFTGRVVGYGEVSDRSLTDTRAKRDKAREACKTVICAGLLTYPSETCYGHVRYPHRTSKKGGQMQRCVIQSSQITYERSRHEPAWPIFFGYFSRNGFTYGVAFCNR